MRSEASFEIRDLSLRVVASTIGGLVLFVLASALLLGPIFGYQRRQHDIAASALRPPQPSFDVRHKFPEPRLQPFPKQDLDDFRRWEDDQLTRYGWEDREHGLVRIPVEEAIDRFVREQRHAR